MASEFSAASENARQVYNAAEAIGWPPTRAGLQQVSSVAAVGVCTAYGAGAASPLCAAIGSFVGGLLYDIAVTFGARSDDLSLLMPLMRYGKQSTVEAFDKGGQLLERNFGRLSQGHARACMWSHWRLAETPAEIELRWRKWIFQDASDARLQRIARGLEQAIKRGGKRHGHGLLSAQQEIFAVVAACTAFYETIRVGRRIQRLTPRAIVRQ